MGVLSVKLIQTLFLLLVVTMICVIFMLEYRITDYVANRPRPVIYDNLPLGDQRSLKGQVELTVRWTVKKSAKKGVHHFFCSLLRSAVVFWNPSYGDVVIILDKDDVGSDVPKKINTLGLPFKFRYVYEDPPTPTREKEFAYIAKVTGRSYGYALQLYSSFFMDTYANASVIAWVDADTSLTMPVTEHSIERNKKLIVKGENTYRFFWVHGWNRSTYMALGYNMVADFMTYFPVYMYPSTVKNCRQYMMKRFHVQRFEDAFIMLNETMVSPVNIIMSYAYYFERDRYIWHIDIGHTTLHEYNKHLTPNYPLSSQDLFPELHVSVHAGYYKAPVHPVTQGLCYMQISLGMTEIAHCKQFYGKPNMQLFDFDLSNIVNHFDTWCKKDVRAVCTQIIRKRYEAFVKVYKENNFNVDTTWISLVENFAYDQYRQTCQRVDYVSFPSKPQVLHKEELLAVPD